jgi:molecular chaperone GrpE (heat shock protein)
MHRIPIHADTDHPIESSTDETLNADKGSSVQDGPSRDDVLSASGLEAAEASLPKENTDQVADEGSPADTDHPGEESIEIWRDRALRLQAEIENYRKRQRRLAQKEIASERERLLNAFAHVADDLRRALDAGESDAKGLREGVALTYRNLVRLLSQEGVEPIEAQGERFNPALHEAVATVPHAKAGVQPQTVIEVTERGYKMGERLLRPARVIVAV